MRGVFRVAIRHHIHALFGQAFQHIGKGQNAPQQNAQAVSGHFVHFQEAHHAAHVHADQLPERRARAGSQQTQLVEFRRAQRVHQLFAVWRKGAGEQHGGKGIVAVQNGHETGTSFRIL